MKRNSKIKRHIGDKDYNFDPRTKHARAKQSELNKQWDVKYDSSKIKYLTVFKGYLI